MSYRLTKHEKETVLLYNQSRDPVTICTYDPGLRRRLREFATDTRKCAGALTSRSIRTMPSTRFRRIVCPSGFSRP